MRLALLRYIQTFIYKRSEADMLVATQFRSASQRNRQEAMNLFIANASSSLLDQLTFAQQIDDAITLANPPDVIPSIRAAVALGEQTQLDPIEVLFRISPKFHRLSSYKLKSQIVCPTCENRQAPQSAASYEITSLVSLKPKTSVKVLSMPSHLGFSTTSDALDGVREECGHTGSKYNYTCTDPPPVLVVNFDRTYADGKDFRKNNSSSASYNTAR